MTPQPALILLTKQLVCERLSLSARTLEGMVKSQQFPKGVRIGKHLYWCEAAVQGWTIRMFGAQEAWTSLAPGGPTGKRAGRASC
jgi:predicted DNA-binding transcriptional regulator AlpA